MPNFGMLQYPKVCCIDSSRALRHSRRMSRIVPKDSPVRRRVASRTRYDRIELGCESARFEPAAGPNLFHS